MGDGQTAIQVADGPQGTAETAPGLPSPADGDAELGLLRDPVTGQFMAGTAAGPGRCAAGRRACIETLELMLGRAENQAALGADLQAIFDKGPAKFLLRFVYPLLPKGAITLDVNAGGVTLKVIGNVSEDAL